MAGYRPIGRDDDGQTTLVRRVTDVLITEAEMGLEGTRAEQDRRQAVYRLVDTCIGAALDMLESADEGHDWDEDVHRKKWNRAIADATAVANGGRPAEREPPENLA